MHSSICAGVQPCDQVVSVLRRIGRAFGGAQDRLVLGQARGRRRRRRVLVASPVTVPSVARRLAVGADHVRLPVVEVQLRGLADLVFGAARRCRRRAARRRFRCCPQADFRLRDAELVDALAHDVDRAVRAIRCRLSTARSACPGRRARRRPSGRARGASASSTITTSDAADQPDDEQQNQQVAAAVGHRSASDYLSGVSTSNSPPSSS